MFFDGYLYCCALSISRMHAIDQFRCCPQECLSSKHWPGPKTNASKASEASWGDPTKAYSGTFIEPFKGFSFASSVYLKLPKSRYHWQGNWLKKAKPSWRSRGCCRSNSLLSKRTARLPLKRDWSMTCGLFGRMSFRFWSKERKDSARQSLHSIIT